MPPGAGQYRFVRVIPVLIFPGARSCVGFVLPAKRQVIPRSQGTGPESADARVGSRHRRRLPALLSADGAPVRQLLMDGYVYDIRDDQDHPSWQEGRWALMNGVRRPGAKRSPARWTRYDTWREAQDSPVSEPPTDTAALFRDHAPLEVQSSKAPDASQFGPAAFAVGACDDALGPKQVG